ncbi:NAD-dependent deacylase [Variovorax sp. OV329]|uniref:SIR2 family NAD-dependent protein deacylase n=1 Tax=Variovorax sp. OV329 TaxID=1882825 RepID=UPI0008F13594|nr:NAD-dependent deacylase [Variovorax sp. OV329]SFM27717.1 NAD-dependent deacetylase [Variovorax sp. OV329]
MSIDVPAPLLEALRSARRIVAFTGAGMSAESGIPTFRDRGTGLWSRFDPQTLATPEAFMRDPEMVWAWYEWRRRKVAHARPNAGHEALAQLAAAPQVERLSIVTQNVDNLHERAGSASVVHLHGSIFSPRCFDCSAPFTLQSVGDFDPQQPPVERLAPPRCPHCGGPIRPGVVWFGEMLPEQAWTEALQLAAEADLMLVIGTSGLVQPAASLPAATRAEGGRVAVINPDPDAHAHASDLYWPVTAATGLPALLTPAASH